MERVRRDRAERSFRDFRYSDSRQSEDGDGGNRGGAESRRSTGAAVLWPRCPLWGGGVAYAVHRYAKIYGYICCNHIPHVGRYVLRSAHGALPTREGLDHANSQL